jgi:hypothetical protein
MRTVFVDKIASVAQHSKLSHELRLSDDIPCKEGVLIAVRVCNNKTRYNKLELTSGRMATVNQGDIVVGALGHRKALLGYSGHIPTARCSARYCISPTSVSALACLHAWAPGNWMRMRRSNVATFR